MRPESQDYIYGDLAEWILTIIGESMTREALNYAELLFFFDKGKSISSHNLFFVLFYKLLHIPVIEILNGNYCMDPFKLYFN